MKRLWILSLIVLFISSELYTQERELKVKVYKTWVTTIDGAKIKGYLHSADAEGIMVNPGKDLLSQDLIAIESQEISKIKVRRKGQVLIGAVAGFAVGATVGILLNESDDSSSGWDLTPDYWDAIAVGSTAAIGTGLGALAATGRRSFDINGSLETYAAQLPLLQKYSYLVE
ncbi:hypothetical protein J1N09_01530 [Aureitalea sp. L0-47]|uniref:hypothetical protein n=1 Tax=Aureitalea sp. L0-47 TaxID=2816962 RepID=UPI002238D060|nr:hypothetical protein [Aureitalea sp. L0-47]MCW5518501.1 hypothetical protein [Aureitalea sp. L0-47]